jgi:hypothetical protein
MKLEYVASGCGGTKLLSDFVIADEEAKSVIDVYLKRLNDCDERHCFSFLFNALTEKALGKKMRNHYSDALYKIHADSGGLQEVTLGKKIADKNVIYQTQIDYSDVAMSFDEVPVIVPSTGVAINASGSKLFSNDLLRASARKSGENLRNQIRYFQSKNADARIFLILQGNSFESYQIWLDEIWDVIKDEDLSYVGGITSGAAALGMGAREDYDRAFYALHLDYPEPLKRKHYHVLGVGSIHRLIPFMLLPASQDCHISYDSTTFTKALFTASFYRNGTMQSFHADPKETVRMMMEGYNPYLSKYGLPELDDKDLLQFSVTAGGDRKEFLTDTETMVRFAHNRAGVIAGMTLQFYNDCNKVIDFGSHSVSYSGKRDKTFMADEAYSKIRDLNDYNEWKKNFGLYLSSNKVPTLENTQVFEL